MRICPEIIFLEQYFCFTGFSQKAKRGDIVKIIESPQGIYQKNVTHNLNYLIVGADSNPCWAFSCYGCKVEKVMNYRKQGDRAMIVHEFDFWDAVEDSKL